MNEKKISVTRAKVPKDTVFSDYNNNNSLYCQNIKVHIFYYILVAYTLKKNLP